MKLQRILTGIVLACSMAGTVQAASTLTSGVVYGGPDQTHVACEVVNLSNAPITFVKKQIIGHFNGSLPLNFDDCGTALAPNRICTFQAATPGSQGAACKFIINQLKTNIRGTMVALTGPAADPIPLSESDLR
jgi:hypothetical protein